MNYARIAFHCNLKKACLSLLICSAAMSAADAAPQSDKREILNRARQRYYNLRQAGLIDYQANIQPNWEVLLTGVEAKSFGMKLLNGLHFSMSIDSASRLRMDHHADVTPPDQKSVDRREMIFKQVDESVSRFVATWSIFMLTSPFPDIENDYEAKEVAGQYQFSHQEGANHVLTITDKDFMIIEIKVSGAGFNASLKPILEQTPRGLILKGYAANYETLSGRSTQVKVRVDYQEISGLQLPRKVGVDVIYGGKPAQVEWLFTDYQVKVR
jgi:hypothetical protein